MCVSSAKPATVRRWGAREGDGLWGDRNISAVQRWHCEHFRAGKSMSTVLRNRYACRSLASGRHVLADHAPAR